MWRIVVCLISSLFSFAVATERADHTFRKGYATMHESFLLETRRAAGCRYNPTGCCVPDDPKNGRVLLSSTGPKFGALATFTCDEFYKIGGEQGYLRIKVLTCDRDHKWNLPIPRCEQHFCRKPNDLTNGYVVGHVKRFLVGLTVTFACDPGYILEGDAIVTCVGPDAYDKPFPKCKDPKEDWCNKIMILQNGFHTANTDIPDKTTIFFYCNAGYTRFGAPSAMCDKGDWIWEGDLPYCSNQGPLPLGRQPYFSADKKNAELTQRLITTIQNTRGIQCPRPWLENGKAIYKRRTVGSKAFFLCDSAYELVGATYLHCGHDLQWTGGVIPECRKRIKYGSKNPQ